ncbi:MAG TPA: DHA2 family efflux MFS transporter permease subunit [Acidimicrobiales bacterium]|nr:DHA2 family efflux MFS transporter permease subunit [Acidimicrobiales bacterium]
MATTASSSRPLSPPAEPQPGGGILSREILAPAAVVVLGAIMTILDATIVNVALPVLGRDLHTSISTIQWVPTIYLLAFASVIPLTGWASQRFGAKRLWLASIATFVAGSVLAGMSWSIGSLIFFRVLQGLGGGMIMPLGQMMLAQVAGPKRMGRVMSIVGVPMLVVPIFGPLIGGSLISAASWRWIFFINLPVGVVAFVAALRLLPSGARRAGARLDVLGLVLLSGGLAISLYGLAEVGQRDQFLALGTLGPIVLGIALVIAFVAHAFRVTTPLIDVRLFLKRGFASAAVTNFVLGVGLFGAMLLLPLYFEIVRDRTPFGTGLLLVPQGLGAAIAISIAGALTDKVGARRVVLVGVTLALLGTAVYTQIGAHTSYWYLAFALFLIGAGLGSTITPSMTAAYQELGQAEMAGATSAINVIQRVAGSIGSALLAVVLQGEMASRLPGLHGGINQAAALAAHSSGQATAALAHSFGASFFVAFALTAAAVVPAVLLPAHRKASPSAGETPPEVGIE